MDIAYRISLRQHRTSRRMQIVNAEVGRNAQPRELALGPVGTGFGVGLLRLVFAGAYFASDRERARRDAAEHVAALGHHADAYVLVLRPAGIDLYIPESPPRDRYDRDCALHALGLAEGSGADTETE